MASDHDLRVSKAVEVPELISGELISSTNALVYCDGDTIFVPSGAEDDLAKLFPGASVVPVSGLSQIQIVRRQGGPIAEPTPTLTGISPASGSTAGGETVTLGGTSLAPAPGGIINVTIGGNAATVTAATDDSVTVTTPSHAIAGTVDVTVITPNGSATLHQGYTYVTSVGK